MTLDGVAVSGRTLGSVPDLVRALGQVKVAAARANRDAGVIDDATASAIEAAAGALISDDLLPADLPADLLTGGGSIAVHTNINAWVAQRAGMGVAEVSTSQSTADVCHTAHRLAVVAAWTELDRAGREVVTGLRAVAARFESIPTLARTCLRDAMVTPLSTIFSGSADALDRRREALATAVTPLHQVVMGATVIGSGDGAPPAYRAAVVSHLASVTGLALEPHGAPASALQHGDDLAALSAAVVQLSRPLLKLATDLRLLGSGPEGGFGELVLPHVMDGSSFFAGKSNPVVPETVIQACLQIRGLDHTVQLAADRAELYLQVFDGLIAVDVLDEIALLTRCFGLLDRLVLTDLVADEARCRQLASFAAPTKADRP
ncbi:MAG TPA: lyase family protein [Acidimicrobiales bacterium]